MAQGAGFRSAAMVSPVLSTSICWGGTHFPCRRRFNAGSYDRSGAHPTAHGRSPESLSEFSVPLLPNTQNLQSQVIVDRDLDILLGPQIAFGGLDRRVPQQEFDLLQIPAVLPAQLGAGATEVVGAEVLDPDLLR